MSVPIDPENVGSFSVLNNRVYLTPDFSNRDPLRKTMEQIGRERPERLARMAKNRAKPWHIRIWSVQMRDDKIAEEKYDAWVRAYSPETRQRSAQREKAEAEKLSAEKAEKRPTFAASFLVTLPVCLLFAGISFLFGLSLVGSGLAGLGGLILFCAWMDYDEKLRKWQERQNAEINAKLEEIRRNSAPSSSPEKTAKQVPDQRLVPKGMEDGAMIYTVEGKGEISYDWIKSEIERQEKRLKELSTEGLLNEIRRREAQGEN